jgi:hypothetical protein
LFVQKDKAYMSGENPKPQLIAEAIAAFWHNTIRQQELHLEPVAKAIMPAITLHQQNVKLLKPLKFLDFA